MKKVGARARVRVCDELIVELVRMLLLVVELRRLGRVREVG